jgi:hypothetical protein
MTPLRQRLVEEAKSWIGTPFVHHQCVKGAGVDCCTILTAVYDSALGIHIELPHYDVQWNLHTDSQPYLTEILRHCREVSPWPGEDYVPEPYSTWKSARGFKVERWDQKPPLPADLALWWFGRAWAHVTIVLEWPTVLNPMMHARVTPERAHTIGSISTMAMRMRVMRPKALI